MASKNKFHQTLNPQNLIVHNKSNYKKITKYKKKQLRVIKLHQTALQRIHPSLSKKKEKLVKIKMRPFR